MTNRRPSPNSSDPQVTSNSTSGRASWSFGYSPAGGVSKTASVPGVAEADRRQGAPAEGAATEGGPQPGQGENHACHTENCEHAVSQQPRVRHRTRQPRQRNRFRNVRLSDSELALISAGAKAAGMTDAGFLAHAGLAAARDLTTTAARIAGDRELLAELFAARRHLGQVGNNLNQIAKILNSDGHAPQTDVVLSAVRRATDRLQAATVRLLDQ